MAFNTCQAPDDDSGDEDMLPKRLRDREREGFFCGNKYRL
jgi:hypothetical protein